MDAVASTIAVVIDARLKPRAPSAKILAAWLTRRDPFATPQAETLQLERDTRRVDRGASAERAGRVVISVSPERPSRRGCRCRGRRAAALCDLEADRGFQPSVNRRSFGTTGGRRRQS